jgi:hypothetical protein
VGLDAVLLHENRVAAARIGDAHIRFADADAER